MQYLDIVETVVLTAMFTPKWRHGEEYPSNLSPVRWAWEFLRRNASYQEDWEYERKQYATYFRLRGHKADPPYITLGYDEDSERKKRSKGRLYYANKYGIYEMLNPAISAHDKITIEPLFGSVYFQRRKSLFLRPMTIGLYRGQALGLFDLNLPIDGQVRQITRKLKDAQREYIAFLKSDGEASAKRRTMRRHQKLYKTYLRLLDGEGQGATTEEIAASLFPYIPNCWPDYNGSRRVRDGLKAAQRLRDWDYRYIPAGWVAPAR